MNQKKDKVKEPKELMREFLEEQPLYSPKPLAQPYDKLAYQVIPKPPLHMVCTKCGSAQTFRHHKDFGSPPGPNHNVDESIVAWVYLCQSCRKFERWFVLQFKDERGVKVGQFPARDVSLPRSVRRWEREQQDLFKKGIICESQGYGIGAFAYFRRIVEDVIDGLLTEISQLFIDDPTETDRYLAAKNEKTAQKKIELVKDHLPKVLRPGDFNPLTVLHDKLSQGLHAGSDEDCLRDAAILRDILAFLLEQVAERRKSGDRYTAAMRKHFEKESDKGAGESR